MESLPFFDSTDPAIIANPYPHYVRYREHDPVHRAPTRSPVFPEQWVLFRHADVTAALRDPRLGRDWHAVTDVRSRSTSLPEPVRALVDLVDHWMLSVEPPLHTSLRGAVNDAFRPRALVGLEDSIAARARALLAERDESTPFELLHDFALPLTSNAIADVMGIPIPERAEFLEASRGLEAVFGGAPSQLPRAAAAAHSLAALFERCITRATEGFLTRFQSLDGLELRRAIGSCILIYGAGFATTVHAIANGALALARHPEQWRLLCGRRELLPSAAEEVLRYDPPSQRSQRFASDSIELGGRVIPKGALIVPVLGSANRDPAVFPDPDRFDLTREVHGQTAFGGGIHSCLGAWLARLELRVALGALCERFESLAETGERLEWREGAARGLRRLPLAVRAR